MAVGWQGVTVLAGVLMLSGQPGAATAVPPSGPAAVTRGFPVTAFDAVDVSAPVIVRIVAGDRVAGRMTGAPDALGDVSAVVSNRTLVIAPRARSARAAPDSWRGPLPPPAEVIVTAAPIARLQVSGSADVTIAEMAGEDVIVRSGGSGRVTVASINAGDLVLMHGGSGAVSLAGRVGGIAGSVTGSGAVDASALDARRVSLAATGSASVTMRASDTAEVASSGSGAVAIDGTATCRVRVMGTGRVTCGRDARR